MSTNKPTPRDKQSEFKVNELFFSTTDKKGIITAGNKTFVRVSKYSERELIAAPHSIIRHPEMPRAVFKLLWDYIENGKTIAAYVKNMSADGSFYWVVALASPIPGGYLSVRFKPSGPLFPTVQNLYAELKKTELATGDRGDARKDGMARATEQLLTTLKSLGVEDYDAFMRLALHSEMKCRDEALDKQLLVVVPPLNRTIIDPKDSSVSARVRRIYEFGRNMYSELNTLYHRLDDFVGYTEELEKKSQYVLELSRGFRLISMNTSVRSVRLGDRGRSLGVIADHMGNASHGIERSVSEISKRIHSLTARLRSIIFMLAAARLQLEMIQIFCAEVVLEHDDSIAERDTLKMIGDLQSAFASTFSAAANELEALRGDVQGLDNRSQELTKTVIALRFSQLAGTVEVCRLHGADGFTSIFEEIGEQLEHAQTQLKGLGELFLKIETQVKNTPAVVSAVNSLLSCSRKQVESQVDQISSL